MSDLTQALLREYLHYDPLTGVWTWITQKRGKAHVGDHPKPDKRHGYRHVGLFGKRYRTGRLAFLYMTGKWPKGEVDHWNRVRHDDTWTNLRDVTPTVNQSNKHVMRNNTSGYTGVAKHNTGKWRAVISVANRQKHLGVFDTREAAHARVLQAKAELGRL